jgi:hypothetical protein
MARPVHAGIRGSFPDREVEKDPVLKEARPLCIGVYQREDLNPGRRNNVFCIS